MRRPSERQRFPAEVEELLDRAVAGAPRLQRGKARRELVAYLEDALADLAAEGQTPAEAASSVRSRFGDPERVADGFRAVPPPRALRRARRTAGPLSAAVLGLVLGLALVQMRAPLATPDAATLAATPSPALTEYVREVDGLAASDEARAAAPTALGYQPVAARLGVARFDQDPLEPSLPALTPTWLPDGYDAATGALFLTPSMTAQLFTPATAWGKGIVVEVLRPDRSTVFQVKERHIFPVAIGQTVGYYIDGEWEIRGPQDEPPAPASWRTDRSRSVLFSRDGLLVLVAGPADVLDADTLVRISRSLRGPTP